MIRCLPVPSARVSRRACAVLLAAALPCVLVPLASAQTTTGGAAAALAGATIVSRDVAVRADDTFAEIARRELGSAGLAAPLAEFNELVPDAPLSVGQLVRVPIHVPARGEAARVVFVKGEVTIDGAPLERDALIIPGNTLVTGANGFASIEFSSGSVVNLQPDTTATIARLNCLEGDDSCLVEIEAEGGDLSSDVRVRDGQPVEFRISTPYASAAVRGTVFDFIVDPGTLRAAVTEGAVDVEALGESLTLDRGFGSVTRAGQPPGEPIALLPAPVFRTAPTRAAAGDAVAWFGLSGVARYSATLALDEAGVNVVREFDTAEERVVIPPDIDDGDYWMVLRGIDDNELPGFPAAVRLGLVDIDPDVAPVEVSITREGQEFLVEIIDPPPGAPGFEIQVSTTPDFADPLGVEVAETGRAVLRLDTDTLYARARTLVDLRTVSAFGPVASGR